jgi:iron complex outermembrane recepter protein
MFKRTKISTGVLLALGGVLLAPVAVQAQEAQRIEVTGSRIKSINADSPSPVQVLTSEDIAKSGATNVQELLLKNPAMGTPAISRTNSNFQTSSAGVSTVDLRNLGTSRTLVLINGRRVVAGVPGDTSVDLNTIPTDFIERVELLTGGASSVYGSDAVAGVVNIIFKKNFDGVTVDVQTGASEKGDDKKNKASLTFGTTSADGKSSLMAHLAVSKQGAVFSRDRERSAVDQTSVGAQTGEAADLFTPRRPFYSSFAPQGRFFYKVPNPLFGTPPDKPEDPPRPEFITQNRTFDAQGNLIPFSTNGPAGDGVGATGFNRSAYRTIAVPTNRVLFSAKGDHAITDEHTVFFEATYAGTQTRTKLEPFPADLGADVYPDSGVIPADTLINGVIVKNPLIPQALYDRITPDADGIRRYGATRRLADVGTRGNVADRDFSRIVTGLKGDLGKTWSYDAFIGYGVSKESQVGSGQYNTLNMRNALEAVPDVDDVNGNGNVTEAICRDATARAQGCVPINIFGANTISPAALKYVQAPSLLSTFTSQKLAGLTVSGEPFALPAGPLGVAVGGEYRKEYARTEFDALTQSGLNGGNAIPRTEGSFSVRELFGEVRVPLLKGITGVKQLQALLAVRGGNYSTVGNTLSWNGGLEWLVNNDLKFRATSSLSTRAPNINELYSPPSQTFPADLVDPCVGVTSTSVGAKDDRCRAATGVAANIAANAGAFTQSQADQQGISGFDRGNPNLSEEKGRSFTAGVVVTPSSIPALRNFTFSADYYKIKIADAIVSTPRRFILDQCYNGDATFCQFIKRRAIGVGANNPGSLEFVDSASTNSGGQSVEGVDLTVSFADKVGPGRMNSKLTYSYLKEASVIPSAGAAPDPSAGEIGEARNRFTLVLGYDIGDFGISTTTTYVGKSALDDQFLKSLDIAPGSVKVGSKTYFDFQATYQIAKRAQVYFGVDNAFNTSPPPIISGLPGNVTGSETASDVYDAIGRRYYVGVRASF